MPTIGRVRASRNLWISSTVPAFRTLESSMEQSFAGLLDALDQAGTPDEAWRAGSQWLAAAGVQWCLYTYTAERWVPGGQQRIRYSSLPQSWMDYYAAQCFFRVDPAIRHCIDGAVPTFTGIDAPARVDGPALRLWEDALSAGLGSGVVIPLRLPGSALGGFSLVTGMVGREFLAWHQRHGRWATLGAHAIDQRVLTLASPPVEMPRLSPRERECLTWLAGGLRHDRIADDPH
jgi:hypothetical protein